jgi:hypothetical protein
MNDRVELWRSPGGRLHARQRCSGNGQPQNTRRTMLSPEAARAALDSGLVCRCARTQVQRQVPVCEWFALCDRPADWLIPHPILGQVPTCQRCADKLNLADLPGAERLQEAEAR